MNTAFCLTIGVKELKCPVITSIFTVFCQQIDDEKGLQVKMRGCANAGKGSFVRPLDAGGLHSAATRLRGSRLAVLPPLFSDRNRSPISNLLCKIRGWTVAVYQFCINHALIVDNSLRQLFKRFFYHDFIIIGEGDDRLGYCLQGLDHIHVDYKS